jgi:tRNA-dihydrouridine synthase A
MRGAVDCPVTVKTRIGLDHEEGFDYLARFIAPVADAGCETFIIHARKAWLKGLSPRENREIPPLDYDVPRQVKAAFPHLNIIVNGGIDTVRAVQDHLQAFDGVMIGRAAYQTPWFLAELEQAIWGTPSTSRVEIALRYRGYIEQHLKLGVRLHAMTRHMFGLFAGQRGGRAWRRHLSEAGVAPDAGLGVYDAALALVSQEETAQAA